MSAGLVEVSFAGQTEKEWDGWSATCYMYLYTDALRHVSTLYLQLTSGHSQ